MTRVCALSHYGLRHPNASSGLRHAAHLACHTLNPSEREDMGRRVAAYMLENTLKPVR